MMQNMRQRHHKLAEGGATKLKIIYIRSGSHILVVDILLMRLQWSKQGLVWV
jgi:hypothetical protein